MLRRITLVALVFVAFDLLPNAALADASKPLVQALSTLQNLGPQSFASVVGWSRAGAPQVFVPIRDFELAEAQILNLSGDDRQAVLAWLQGNGRFALYARGATDSQIGPLRPQVDSGAAPAPTPSQNPWRDLKLASATLDAGASPSKIAVLGGFAAAKRDGTSATACVSFQNNAALTATRVVIDFPLLGSGGDVLGRLDLDRHGTFSPGIAIYSYQSYAAWIDQSGGTNRDYANNCATISNGIAAVPILTARFATYRVTRVEYADGSAWQNQL